MKTLEKKVLEKGDKVNIEYVHTWKWYKSYINITYIFFLKYTYMHTYILRLWDIKEELMMAWFLLLASGNLTESPYLSKFTEGNNSTNLWNTLRQN